MDNKIIKNHQLMTMGDEIHSKKISMILNQFTPIMMFVQNFGIIQSKNCLHEGGPSTNPQKFILSNLQQSTIENIKNDRYSQRYRRDQKPTLNCSCTNESSLLRDDIVAWSDIYLQTTTAVCYEVAKYLPVT